MPTFPIDYEVELTKTNNEPMVLRSGRRPLIQCGPPPEFGGNEMMWSPEHLFVSALASCLTATFVSMVKRAAIVVGEIHVEAHASLGRNEADATTTSSAAKKMAFTEATLTFMVRVLHDDVHRTKELFDAAKAHCFVANSIACPVNASIVIEES